ncbi:MAG: MMPL family transporter [Spirochaetaceae bacterium]|jgi:predicted RND superfamily exporter protein|nr:MMPL family transporter [Spirochaetaceae bacterium]
MEKLFKHPSIVVGFIAAVTVFFSFQLQKVELDNNNFRFLPKNDPARVVSDYIEEEFGGSVLVLVGLERPYGTVFDAEFLKRTEDYINAAESIEYVKNINSIMSTQYITGNSDSIIVDDLVSKDFSGTPSEIEELKQRIASWDIFRGAIVSEDLSATQILISLDIPSEDAGNPRVNASLIKIRDSAKIMFNGLANVYVAGLPVVSSTINESMNTDLKVLIPLVILVVLAILLISFRRLSFVLLPLITVIVVVIWTIGAMPFFGIRLSILSTVLPVILVAVGSAYGIHIVTHYMHDVKGAVLTVEEHRTIVFALLRKIIKPVFLAALTTFSGFVSFCFTPIVPMREFGVFSSLGVIISFIVAVTLIPSLILMRGPRSIPKTLRTNIAERRDKISIFITNLFYAISQRNILVFAFMLVVAAVSVYGLSKIVVDNVLLEFFQNNTDISRSDRFIREYFGGSKELVLVVQADTTEELLNPAVLSAVDGLSTYLTSRIPEVGKVVGFTDVIKRINQVFNVDESPDGLRPVVQNTAVSDDGFGFGFDSVDDSSSYSTVAEPENIPDKAGLDQYTAADIIKLLDIAASKREKMYGNDLVRELERLTNYNGFAYYEIPADPERYGKKSAEELQALVSNYLVLLAGDSNLEYSNDPLEPTAIKTLIQLRTTGQKDTQSIIDIINAYISSNFPKNVKVVIGGGATIEGAISSLVVNSQIVSIIISVIMVFIIIALSNRSFVAGIIAAAPLTLVMLCNFSVMGFLKIKLNVGTALISSLAVGIGIDYTIHFIEFFKREYNEGGGDFLRRTFMNCGKSIMINAISVGAGFGVLAASRFRILAELGLLVSLSMLITAVISLTLIPAMLITFKPKFIYNKKLQEEVK